MNEKRFEIFPQNVTKDGTLIIIQKGLKLYNISDVVELLNALYEENEQLKKETVFLAYWKRKAMILLMQVRRLTRRMTDKEVIEFSKELEDE